MDNMYAALTKSKLFVLGIFISLTASLSAQTVYIGTGTSPISGNPVNCLSGHSATESLYLGSEINATGNITKVAYYKNSGTSGTTPAIKIYMRTTSATTVGSSAYTVGATNFSSYTLVYDGALPNTANGTGLMEVSLQTPFSYTSTSNNLLVLVVNTTSIASGRPQYRGNSAGAYRCGAYSSSSAWTSASSMSVQVDRAHIQLTLTPASGCNVPTSPTISNLLANTATVSWTAPASGTTPVGYQWEVRSSGAAGSGSTGLAASGSTTAPTVSANAIGLTANTAYTLYVRTDCGSSTYSASWASVGFTTACAAINPPYTQNFDGSTAIPTCTAVQDVNADSKTWTMFTATTYANSGSNALTYTYHNTNAANDWWFTPGINVVSGNTYKISFAYRVRDDATPEGLEIKTGTAQNAAGMTSSALYSNTALANETYATATFNYTATSTGVQYFGWHAISAAFAYNLYIDDISITALPACNTVSFPSSVNTVASKTTICSEAAINFSLSAAMPEAAGITYQWKSSADGTTYTNAGSVSASPAATLTANTGARYFKCDVLCNGSTTLTSNPVQITLQVEVTSTTAGARCGTGSVTLQATGASGNTLKWYNQSSNGTLLGTGTSFNTPSISGNTTYYVAADGGGSDVALGASSPSIGSLGSNNNGYGMTLATTNAVKLKSVDIYPVDAGTNYIQLRNSSGTVLQQIAVTVTAGEANSTNSSVGTPKTVTLNWDLAAGTTYQLYWPQTTYLENRLLRNLAGATSYYNVAAGGVSYTGNVNGSGNSYWYYFYNTIITTGCGESPRVPVTATVNAAVTGVSASNNGTVPGSPINFTSTPNGAASYAWSGPNSFTSNVQNPVIASGSLSNNGVYTVTVTNSSNCSASANTTVAIVPTDYVWTGTIDNSWYNTGNWNVSVVPNDSTANVTIPGTLASGNYPEIASNATVRNISVESNARITIDGTLNVKGSWTGGNTTAAIILGNGKMVLNAYTAQTINGNTQLQTLLLNNNAGASLASSASVEVFKAAELQKGTLSTSNGTLRFRSTSATECATINNFGSGYTGTLSGNIETERYYAAPSANSFNQHYMGSPVDAPSVAQFGASGTAGYVNSHANCYVDVMVSGSAYGTFYEYDETHGNQCGIESWKVVTVGNAQNGKGYSVAKTGSGVLTLSGTANLNTSYTVSSLGNAGWSNQISYQTVGSTTPFTVNAGWHLISNPYLASLNIGNHAANNAFDAQIQVWQTTGAYAGSYQPVTAGVNAQIAPFQAFMVHKTATGGSASYTLYASDRSTNSNTFYRQANTYELKLVAENTSNGLLDQTVVAFNSDATTQFDPMYDANKVQGGNSRHTLRTVINDVKYAINTLGDLTQTSTVPVHMRPGLGGTFKFTAEGINTFDPTSYIYLEDKVTGEWVDLRQQAAYTFTMNVNDAENRFVLHFTPAAEMNTADATCDVQGSINITQAGMANWNYTLTNANGANIATGTLNEATPMIATAPKGTYTLTLSDANNYTVIRTITIGGAEPAQANFTASANTIEENESVVLTASNANASYVWDLGNGATATGSGVTIAYIQAGVYTVTLQTTNSYGCTATSTQLITVNEAVQTGINGVDKGNVAIWSYGNTVTIQLAASTNGATAEFYNAVGQLLHTATLSNTVYNKSFGNLSSGYVIVKVLDNNTTTIKKVTINN